MKKFQRYKQNLCIQNENEVWSYTTKVGIIKDDCIEELGYWSMTTRKHLNYVAKEYSKPLIKFC
jgi:hypothetical protein